MGLEGSERNVKLATDRQNTLHPTTKDKIKYVKYFVTKNSASDIKNKLHQEYPEFISAGIIGLHACADLSITALQLFLEMDVAKCLVIMPCCYHRLQMSSESDSESETFENFPVSGVLKELYHEFNGQKFLRRYFLRLACQQSSSKVWNLTANERDLLVKNCLYRAILEKVAEEGKYIIALNGFTNLYLVFHPPNSPYAHRKLVDKKRCLTIIITVLTMMTILGEKYLT